MARASQSYYLSAQICLNGHVITSGIEFSPELRATFCHLCGAATTETCRSCSTSIRGSWYSDLTGSVGGSAPNYCHQCGASYPWTDHALEAARELTAELDLTNEEKARLNQTVADLVTDSPRTPVAIARFKRLTAKAGGWVGESFRQILVDVVSETVKKQMWP